MNSESSQRVQELFLAALEISPEERDSWLAKSCQGNEDLLKEVLSLLQHDSPAKDPLEQGLHQLSDSEKQQIQRDSDAPEKQGNGSASLDTKKDSRTLPNANSEPERQTDKIFGDYEVIEEIARGGMGIVFKARQVSLNRVVALKMILSGKWAGPDQIQRFQSEAAAAAKMDHPGIVPIYDFGHEDDQHYFTMRFVEGESLSDKLKNGPLSPKDSAEMVKRIAEAVAYAHENGVIHRDLKPANVLMDEGDVPRVTDFGLAKQVDSDDGMTHSGTILGTPSYMSPEQAAGKVDQVDRQSDVYSLGALFYFLLTGRPPFQASTIQDTLRQVFEEEPIAVRKLNPSAPKDLETICLKALSKEKNRRYESAKAFADDIDRWISNKPIQARRVGRLEKIWIWSKRQPMVAGLAIVLILISVVGSLLFWERQNASHAEGLVLALLKADTNETADIINELDSYRYWAEPRLKTAFQSFPEGTKAKLHAAIGLLGSEEQSRDYLAEQMFFVHPSQFNETGNALADFLTAKQVKAFKEKAASDSSSDQQFRAACALAIISPDDRIWENSEIVQLVADQLVAKSPSEFLQWLDVLRPARKHLVPPLANIFRNSEKVSQQRNFATDCLAEFVKDEPDKLFQLLIETEQSPQRFQMIFERIKLHKDRATQLAQTFVEVKAEFKSDPKDRDAQSLRKANAAMLLLQLGDDESIWPLLKDSTDPSLRSYIIHFACRRNEEFATIVERLKSELDPGIKQALLLCLGSFEQEEEIDEPLVDMILDTYLTASDSGVHSAAEWVLRRWGKEERIKKSDSSLQRNEEQRREHREKLGESAPNWYVNSQGQTFVVIEAKEFSMGSPLSEFGRKPEEAMHRRKIDRRMAVATKEITVGQWKKFFEETKVWNPNNPQLFHPTDDSPMLAMTWYEAAQYCNWLSDKDGIPKDQHCYVPNPNDRFGPGMKAKKNFWKLAGYRLPTEGEWEFACRSGAVTSRHFGESDSLLPNYAWYRANTKADRPSRTGRLKPNRFGLFDIQGNVYEWCYDEYKFIEEYIKPTDILGDWPQDNPLNPTQRRVMRGGAFNFDPKNVRSADRYSHLPSDRTYNMGFRPVRTMPKESR